MKTLTVVDDEPLGLDFMVQAAQGWGYQCQSAERAEAAWELFQQNPTPVMVTDLRMPGRGGVWLVNQILKSCPEVSVIVVTAGHDEQAFAQCLAAGVHHYFLKPIHLDEFRHALEATFRMFQLKRENHNYRLHLEHTVHKQTQILKKTFFSAIDSLVRILEARDPYTSGHSFRVRRLVLKLAREMDLDIRFQKQLSLAAKLHDIGKVGLPEAILNKPENLTQDEFQVVREHPIIGERILAPIIRNHNILATIRGHHERYDGTGYPDGLAGERIPLAARMLAIVDCFDALTSSRAYRKAWPRKNALDFLLWGVGTQFDPALVPNFVELMHRNKLGMISQ